jgi:hypothetical protein
MRLILLGDDPVCGYEKIAAGLGTANEYLSVQYHPIPCCASFGYVAMGPNRRLVNGFVFTIMCSPTEIPLLLSHRMQSNRVLVLNFGLSTLLPSGQERTWKEGKSISSLSLAEFQNGF